MKTPAAMMKASTSQAWFPVGHRVVVADHDEQHRQREVVVVDAALLGLLAVYGIGQRPADMASTILRWPGMISISTLPTMMVPIMAPTWM
jgi:hypothetical protein